MGEAIGRLSPPPGSGFTSPQVTTHATTPPTHPLYSLRSLKNLKPSLSAGFRDITSPVHNSSEAQDVFSTASAVLQCRNMGITSGLLKLLHMVCFESFDLTRSPVQLLCMSVLVSELVSIAFYESF